MDIPRVAAVLLIVGVLAKELSYFTPRMIFTYKTTVERIVFGCGVLVLLFLTARFASGLGQVAFGGVGILAFAAMWIKQGVSEKGVLTEARGRELYPWEQIDSVRITRGKALQVVWLSASGAPLLKQNYSEKALPALRERLRENGIKEL